MNESPRPRRRWFRFSLRTMFVVVLLLGIPMAYLARTASTLKERTELIKHTNSFSYDEWPKPLSWRIVSWFGYKPGAVFWDGISMGNATDEEFERMRRVFPEARIARGDQSPHSLKPPEYRNHPPGWLW